MLWVVSRSAPVSDRVEVDGVVRHQERQERHDSVQWDHENNPHNVSLRKQLNHQMQASLIPMKRASRRTWPYLIDWRGVVLQVAEYLQAKAAVSTPSSFRYDKVPRRRVVVRDFLQTWRGLLLHTPCWRKASVQATTRV